MLAYACVAHLVVAQMLPAVARGGLTRTSAAYHGASAGLLALVILDAVPLSHVLVFRWIGTWLLRLRGKRVWRLRIASDVLLPLVPWSRPCAVTHAAATAMVHVATATQNRGMKLGAVAVWAVHVVVIVTSVIT